MDHEEFDHEAIALMIEDMKSEDPSVKLQAVSKLHLAAPLLGRDRIKEELIPYIIEIIEEKDNSDEFLISLIEQIGQLKDHLDHSDAEHLLPPLEIIASMEEPGVRDKAVEKIKGISEGQEGGYFTGAYLNMIKRLALWDNYPSRVSSCYLFHMCYPHLSDNDKLELRQVFSELAHDDTPMVRRAAAANLKNMKTVLENHQTKNELIPLFNGLIKDDIDSVKINAIEASTYLSSFYTKQELIDNLLPLLRNVDPENKSWRVRYALAEAIAVFCHQLDTTTVKKELVPIYDSLIKDSEQEVKSIAMMKIGDILDKLSPEQIETSIIPSLAMLAMDPSLHVRISVATVLSKVPEFLTSEILIKSVLPVIQTLMKDEVVEVKTATIQNIQAFNKKVGPEQVEQHIVPLIQTAVTEKQWRYRLAVIERLPEICESVGWEVFNRELGDFVMKFINDHYFLIRETAVENLGKLIDIFGWGNMKEKAEAAINGLIENTNYLFRLSALNVLAKIGKKLEKKTYENMLSTCIEKFSADKVPNVKFNLIKFLVSLKPELTSVFLKTKVIPKIEPLVNDSDPDVAYFAKTGLEKLK